ncbi:hypothetical protein F5Y11DRAFT_352663 [Daldinia sp. FL1419]|nr:hypothetical protein F5Y11DRAFT_352663 [Daldinia sp. FL1419]
MADEVRQTPIPVPHVYGQPTPSQQAAEAAAAAAASPAGDATTAMTIEQPTDQAASPAPATLHPSNAPSPSPAALPATGSASSSSAPQRTGTPLRTTNGNQEGPGTSSSRATSQHPDPGFTMPAEAPPHGAPVRQYLNSKVTAPLLDGMKLIAKEQPKDPLRVLGEYLLQRSKELESTT